MQVERIISKPPPMECSAELNVIFASETSVDEQMTKERQKRPQHIDVLEEMDDLTQKRLYHQLTDVYFLYLRKDGFKGLDCVEFLRYVVGPLKSKLNPLRLGQLLRLCCQNIDALDALKLLSFYETSFESPMEAHLMFLTSKAYHLTRKKAYKECETLLDDVQSQLEVSLGLDLSVYAAYHQACSFLYKNMEKPAEFYKHGVMYCTYTPMAELQEEERLRIAYELSVAGIIAEDTYNFGELLQLPVTSFLKDCPSRSWIYDLVVALDEGSLELFDSAVAKHSGVIQQSELASHEGIMRRKITVLALMELAFRKPKKQRKLAFLEIADHCRIDKNEVELLLMKAMSNNLVKGQIDEVEQVVRVTWVKPRILNKERLELMRRRVDAWSGSAKELLLHLEELTPELLVS